MLPTAPQSLTADDELGEYRSVSPLAIIGLLISLLAPAAFLSKTLLFVPLFAVGICLLGLRRIALADQTIQGRTVALLGLGIAVFCGSAALSNDLSGEALLQWESERFTRQWFEYLRRGEPHKALQLTVTPEARLPLDDSLWSFYERGGRATQTLRQFTDQPAIRAVLELDARADIRHFEHLQSLRGKLSDGRSGDATIDLWSVSFDTHGSRKTFFIRVMVNRTRDPLTGQGGLQIYHFEGGKITNNDGDSG